MADQDPERPEGNRFPPVKVEWRGRFLLVLGDNRDPHFAQVSEEVSNNFRRSLSPAQQEAESISDLQSAPSSSSLDSLPQSLSSISLTQLQNVPNSDPSFPPSSNPLVSSSQTQTQSSGGPPLRTRSLPWPLGGSGSGSGSGSSRLTRSGPPFASLSMAFFSPQPQQLQTPQFQFQPQQQQMQFPQMQAQFQVPQPQILLYTKEKALAGWSTKFEDLHQESQNVLLQIELVFYLIMFQFLFFYGFTVLLVCMVLGFRVLGQMLVSSAFSLLFYSFKTISIPVKDCKMGFAFEFPFQK